MSSTEGKKLDKELVVSKSDIVDMLGGDDELAIFFISWLENDRDATKTYRQLYPEEVKGAPDNRIRVRAYAELEKIKKINKGILLDAYGLGLDKYLTQLKDGVDATKLVDDGEGMIEVPDHKVRRDYHKVMGELLDMERKGADNRQINMVGTINQWVTSATEIIEGDIDEE